MDVPADVAGRAAALQIVHTHAPRDRFFAALEDIRRATQILVDIANNLRTIVGGSEASADSAASETAMINLKSISNPTQIEAPIEAAPCEK